MVKSMLDPVTNYMSQSLEKLAHQMVQLQNYTQSVLGSEVVQRDFGALEARLA